MNLTTCSLSSSVGFYMKSYTFLEIPNSSIMLTRLIFYFNQFLSSIIIDIGVAGVICFIEYGEFGTL
jgi:hypothetical protein